MRKDGSFPTLIPIAWRALALAGLPLVFNGCHLPPVDWFGGGSKLRSSQSVDLPEGGPGLTQTEATASASAVANQADLQPAAPETDLMMPIPTTLPTAGLPTTTLAARTVGHDGQSSAPGAGSPLMPALPTAPSASLTPASHQPATPAKSANSASAKLKVSGVKPGQGPVRVAVFSQGNDFPNYEQAAVTHSLPSNGPVAEGSLEGLPTGKIALAIYQDVNNDGKLNRSTFGIPTEPYGFSNNARGQYGPPTFQAAMLEAGSTPVTIDVALH
jgi:uncharacterized protein (DUF2141 family)